jgi:hypothetical protein
MVAKVIKKAKKEAFFEKITTFAHDYEEFCFSFHSSRDARCLRTIVRRDQALDTCPAPKDVA